ncbi:MAG: hypothetical protein GX952_06925 [Firmicutes bacterium]|nr:hypothetical protein [Bacillota bacterium]
MKFCFSLARVLKIKGIWEEQAKLKLAAAVITREQEEKLFAEKVTVRNQAFFRLNEAGLKRGQTIAQQYMLANWAKQDCQQQAVRVKEAHRNFSRAQQDFLQRRADRQVLTKLEQKKWAEYIQEKERKDRVQLDEVASLAYLKRQGGA